MKRLAHESFLHTWIFRLRIKSTKRFDTHAGCLNACTSMQTSILVFLPFIHTAQHSRQSEPLHEVGRYELAVCRYESAVCRYEHELAVCRYESAACRYELAVMPL